MRVFPFAVGLLSTCIAASTVAQPSHEAQQAPPPDRTQQAPGIALRLDPTLREARPQPDAPTPTFIRGDSIVGRTDRDLTLQGNAEIRRDGLVVRADRLTYYEIDQEVIAVGDVRIRRDGQVFMGPQLRLQLDANTGTVESPRFTLSGAGGGHGSAARLELLGRDRFALEDAVYSTCRPEDPDWFLRADELTIDEGAGEAVGTGARLVFMGLPLLALPNFSFPLGDGRRSGLLPPSVSITSRTGPELRMPYYWDMAPNRDLTVSPTLMGRRGLQLGGHYRYLEPTYSGEAIAEYLPEDAAAGRDRWFLHSAQQFRGWAGWTGAWYLRGVSDDNYFIDFSRTIVTTAERSLPREIHAVRDLGDWQLRTRLLQHQNILDARLAPPFDRLPQIQLSTQRRDVAGFDLRFHSDASWFSRDLPGSAEGARFVVNPSASYPVTGAGWFIVPRMSVHSTSYRLDANPFGPTQIDRTVPIASIDAGLVMERPFRFRGSDLVQTLEPRLFYVNAPFRDQTQIPIFDASVTTLSYATLFSDRLFSGDDRIANANQLTPGVVSRLIDPATGVETLRLGIAQRWYFEPQRVTIPGVPLRTDPRSDMLLGASAELGGGHGIDAGAQFSLRDDRVPQLDVAWRWWPSQARVFNLALRYRQLDYAQVDASWRQPVAQRWTALGRLNYSVLREQVDATGQVRSVSPQLLEAVAGFEYTSDCWTTRFVVQNFLAAEGQRTSAFFVQLELGGIARLGLNPLDILVRNIPGYRVLDRRQSLPTRFYGYE
jgi:LPS-assembly protein